MARALAAGAAFRVADSPAVVFPAGAFPVVDDPVAGFPAVEVFRVVGADPAAGFPVVEVFPVGVAARAAVFRVGADAAVVAQAELRRTRSVALATLSTCPV